MSTACLAAVVDTGKNVFLCTLSMTDLEYFQGDFIPSGAMDEEPAPEEEIIVEQTTEAQTIETETIEEQTAEVQTVEEDILEEQVEAEAEAIIQSVDDAADRGYGRDRRRHSSNTYSGRRRYRAAR